MDLGCQGLAVQPFSHQKVPETLVQHLSAYGFFSVSLGVQGLKAIVLHLSTISGIESEL